MGLGVRCFNKINMAFMSKWLWCFANERDFLWRKVVYTKFGEERGGWSSSDVRGSFGIGF